jgi:hypothetical protein
MENFFNLVRELPSARRYVLDMGGVMGMAELSL